MCLGGFMHGRLCCPQPVPPPVRPYPLPTIYQNLPKENVVVPLMGAHAIVEVVDYCAKVTVKQRYQNQEKDPIEAVYVRLESSFIFRYEFPLNANASVCEFYAEIDGKKIIGQLKEKEKARNTYDDAIASGHGAYLLEEDKPNHFSCSVGNLPAGKEVVVSIVYVTELEFADGKLQFSLSHLPYPPDGTTVPTFVASKDPNSLYSKLVNVGLKIDVSFDMTSNIKSISSPSHPITFEFGDSLTKANVKLANQDSETVPLLKDFVLSVQLQQPHEPCVRVDETPSGSAVMVSLYPDLERDDIPIYNEMIFIVDRSGSMAGSRINSVKETLQIFLRSLPEGTMFNIIGFGGNTESLFPTSQEYNDTTLEKAVNHVSSMSANLGGTNILKPLMEVFSKPPLDGIPRQIFLLTDGEVSNASECISCVRKNANTTRVFTFGLGGDASKYLVAGMAKAGEGSFEIILNNANLDNQVMRQLSKALKPAFTDLSVDWGELSTQIEQSPFYLPPLFGGGRLIVYGMLPKQFELKKQYVIQLNAKTAKGKFSTSVILDPSKTKKTKDSLIYKLASKSLIRDLEESRSYAHNADGTIKSGKTQPIIDAAILQLSLSSGILSSKTAFVAVEERDDATQGEMKMRKINMEDLYQKDQQSNSNSLPRAPAPSPFGGYGGLPASSAPPVNSGMGPYGALKPVPLSTGGPGRGGSRGPPPPGAAPPPLGGPPPMVVRSAPARGPPPSQGYNRVPSYGGLPGGPPPQAESLHYAPPPPAAPSANYGALPSFDMMDQSAAPKAMSRSSSISQPVQSVSMTTTTSTITPTSSSSSNSNTNTGNDFKSIIKTQKANGTWTLDIVKRLVPSASSSSLGIPSDIKDTTTAELILCTLIICIYFELKVQDQQQNWSLVVKKARSWVKKEAEKLGSSFDWEVAATDFVKKNL